LLVIRKLLEILRGRVYFDQEAVDKQAQAASYGIGGLGSGLAG